MEREHRHEAVVHRKAAGRPASGYAEQDDNLGASIAGLFDLVFEVSKSIGQAAEPGAHSVYAAIDTRIRERGVREVPDGPWIESAFVELAGSIEVLNQAPDRLDVLLRHRPRSIAPESSVR